MGRINHLAIKNDSLFLVYLDALNEFASPAVVLQELAAIVSRCGAAYRLIKFCVTCRATTWDSLTLDTGVSLPQHSIYVPSCEKPSALPLTLVRSTSTVLEDFTNEEMVSAVETYRQQTKFKGQLSKEVAEICSRPLLLRLVSQTWAGKELPQHAGVRKLWDAYWKTTAEAGPRGSDILSLQIASDLVEKQTTEITKARVGHLPAYSEKCLAHLVATRVLRLQASTYEDTLSFGHERLLEYAIARWLIYREADLIGKISSYSEKSEAFSPLQGAICFLTEMMDENFRCKLLYRLAGANDEGKRLVCRLIRELNLLSNEAWEVLESISGDVPLDVVSALGAIGNSRPEKTVQMLANLVDKSEYLSHVSATIFAVCIGHLCIRNESFIRTCEQFLRKGPRYKQISLIALSQMHDYAGWPQLKDAIIAFSNAQDENLRVAVASVICSLAQHDSEAAWHLVTRLAKDANEQVRYQVGGRLSTLLLECPEELKVVTSLAESKDWRERQVASRGIGLAIRICDSHSLYSLAKRLAMDRKEAVRTSLAEGIIAFAAFDETSRSAGLPLVEEVILRSTNRGLITLSDHCQTFVVWVRDTMRVELVPIWSKSDQPKLREFAARLWKGGLGSTGIDSAWRFAADTSSRVRVAFAERLADGHVWKDEDDSSRTFAVAKKLLDDPDTQVRAAVCGAVSAFAEHEWDECVSLLLNKMTNDTDSNVKCAAMVGLLALGAGKLPAVRTAINKYISELRCGGELTKLGMDLGKVAAENKLAFDLLCEMAQKESEPHQHIAAAATLFVVLSSGTRPGAEHYVEILSKMIRNRLFRSHFVAFGLFLTDMDEEKVPRQYRNNLASFVELLKAGYESKNIVVRVWATWASWRCFVLYPTALGQCAEAILNEAVHDPEWRVRFTCAICGGELSRSAK